MAVNIFLKIGEVKGESTDVGHKDEIEILSFSLGASNPLDAGGGERRRRGGQSRDEPLPLHRAHQQSLAALVGALPQRRAFQGGQAQPYAQRLPASGRTTWSTG